MIRMNDPMRRRVPRTPLQAVSWDDVPESLHALIEQGWTVDKTGAYLLNAMLSGYSGSRSSFNDLTGYEASVNGLGVPDWDIRSSDDAEDRLLRRAIAYAYFMLRAARDIEGANHVRAVVSASESLMDPAVLTARVTFVLERANEPALVNDVEARQNECLLVFSLADISS